MSFLPGMMPSWNREVAAGAPTTTWNPSDKHADISLSGGDLIATNSGAGGYIIVRAIASASSGKKYWEVTCTTFANYTQAAGVANSTHVLDNYVGSSNNGIGYFGDGQVYRNAGSVGGIASYAQGDVICTALDMDNSKIWFRVNGGNWNNDVIGNQNPATNTGGISIAAMAAGPYFAAANIQVSGNVLTANFGGSAFAHTAPSGFGNW